MSFLHSLQGRHGNGTQKRGEADAIFMGFLQCRGGINPEAGQIQEAVGLHRSDGTPSVVFPAAGADGSGVFEEAVLQFLRAGRFQAAQYAVHRRNGFAVLLLQILSGQAFQEHQPPVSVGDGMEKLHGNPVFIGNDPDGASPDLLPGHIGQRIAAFFPKGGSLPQLL